MTNQTTDKEMQKPAERNAEKPAPKQEKRGLNEVQIDTYKVGLPGIEELKDAADTMLGDQLIIRPVSIDRIHKTLSRQIANRETDAVEKMPSFEEQNGPDEGALDKKAELADSTIELSKEEAIELNEIIKLFEKHRNAMLEADPGSIDIKAVPKEGLHYLMKESETNEFAEKLRKMGYDEEGIDADNSRIGTKLKKNKVQFNFIFARDRMKKPQDHGKAEEKEQGESEAPETAALKGPAEKVAPDPDGIELANNPYGDNPEILEVQGAEGLIALRIKNDSAEEDPFFKKNAIRMIAERKGLYSKLPKDVQAPRVLGSKEKEGKIYEVIEKALGEPVHKRDSSIEEWQRSLEELAKAPVSHYRKLFEDIGEIDKAGLDAGGLRSERIYYDRQKGFFLLSLDKKEPKSVKEMAIDMPLLYADNLFKKYKDKVNDKIRKSVRTIIGKLDSSGFKLEDARLREIKTILDRK